MRPHHADNWVTEIRGRKTAESTARSYVRAAYSFFKWLVAVRRSKSNPFEGYPRFRIVKRAPRHVPERQIFKLLRSHHPPREKAMLEVLYASGCRLGELASLNLGSVSFKERTARCAGKGGKERLLLFNRAAVRAIKAYLPLRERMLRHPGSEAEPALFVSNVGRRLSVAHLCSLVRGAVTRARLTVAVTAHVIRHSVATHLLNRGADLETIQNILGHTDLRSTVIYAYLLQPRMRRNYLKAIPRIGGKP
jgi:site-specific recombinase XerD